MDAILAALEHSALATHLRAARWEYAAVSAAHIFGITMLVGGILPLDLKLLGFWPGIERRTLARVLVPVAACGLVVAAMTGLVLFSVRAQEYALLTVLRLKLLLVVFGVLAAIIAHLRHGLWLDRRPQCSLHHVGAISLLTWLLTLTCGRLIAFVV